MSHFNSRLTSPHIAMIGAYSYLVIMAIIFSLCGIYNNNKFFRWGPPLDFFGNNITTHSGFYILHFLIFLHQLINNWVNTVVYPWIINSIQDPKNRKMEYNTFVSLLLVNLFNIYSEFDVIIILMGFTSQLSFIVPVNIANIISSTYVNYYYIRKKKSFGKIHSSMIIETIEEGREPPRNEQKVLLSENSCSLHFTS